MVLSIISCDLKCESEIKTNKSTLKKNKDQSGPKKRAISNNEVLKKQSKMNRIIE